MRAPHIRHLALAVCVATLVVLSTTQIAWAHARLLRSNPEDGAVLDKAPREIYLWFDEAIGLEFSAVEVLNADGRSMGAVVVRGDPTDPALLIATLPDLPDGIYRVAWRAWSAADSHLTRGALVFGAGAASGAEVVTADQTETAISPLEVGLRGVNYLALALIAGCLVVAGAVLKPAPAAVTRRVWRAGLSATLGAIIVGAGLLAWQTHTLGRESPIELLGTRFGGLWLMRQFLLILVLIALIAARENHRRAGLTAWLLISSLAVIQALNSHAAGLPDRTALAVGVDAVHQLAAGVWVGSMPALLIALLPLLRSSRAELTQIALSGWRRFGVIAAISVGVLAASGLYNAGRQVASIDAWLSTSYGQILSSKIGLFLIVGLCGLINSMLLHPTLAAFIGRVLRRPIGWTPLARSRLPVVLVAEVGAGMLVFAASGLLTAAVPARGPEFAPITTALKPPSSLSMPVDDLLVTLSIGPNKPGSNIAVIQVRNTRRPAPAEIIRVMLRLTYRDLDTQTLIAERVDDSTYRLSTNVLSAAGDWRLRVVVRRKGLEDSVADFAWQVEALPAGVPPRPVVVSNAPLEPILATFAIGLALLTIAAAARTARLRLPSRRPAALDRFRPRAADGGPSAV